jgi:N-sulfoglucosamine sulfohydrolase
MGVDVPELREEVAAYYNCVSRADTGIGMVLQALKDRGLEENTLVIFLSDNGPEFARGKVSSYEAGLQVPFIVRWPKGEAGLICNKLISAVDIVPTILDAAGIKTALPLPGRSLLPLLEGKEIPLRNAVGADYTAHRKEHYYPRRSIRTDRYKLIHNLLSERTNPLSGMGVVRALDSSAPVKNGTVYNVVNPDFYLDESRFSGGSADAIRSAYATYRQPSEFELYDLEKDPCERSNLAENPEYATVLASLKNDLKNWQSETEDPFADPVYLREFTAQTDALCK